jgi:AraC family transcriptional regulator
MCDAVAIRFNPSSRSLTVCVALKKTASLASSTPRGSYGVGYKERSYRPTERGRALQSSVMEPAAKSIAAEIARTTGVRPMFLVKNGDDAQILAAKWRLPKMSYARSGCSQHVLAFQARGSATITRTLTSGKRTTNVASPGSVTFMPAEACVESKIESPVEAVHIYIEAAALGEVSESPRKGTGADGALFSVRDPWLVGYFQMLVSECEVLSHPEPLADSPFLAETGRLLLRHLRDCHFKSAASGPSELHAAHLVHPLRPVLVRRIEEYVEANLERDIPLRPLAEIAHMSVDHFVRTFSVATGKTPHQYVLERRLDRAAVLLRRDASPLAEIARACGFRNASHFSVRFNAHFGMPPSRYRWSA